MMTMIINMFLVIVIFGIGILVGLAIARKHIKDITSGIFHINTIDPNKDIINIELNVPITELMNMNEVVFTIDNQDS